MSGLLQVVGFATVVVFVFKMSRSRLVLSLHHPKPQPAQHLSGAMCAALHTGGPKVVRSEYGWSRRPEVDGRVWWFGPSPGPPAEPGFAEPGDVWLTLSQDELNTYWKAVRGDTP